MRRLSSLILSLLLTTILLAQKSPHGDSFTLSCKDCHNPDGWKIDMKTLTFNHGATKFPLVGQHQAVNCRQCHTSLNFTSAGKECVDCHTDMHNQTVGPDCGRCHTTVSWVVNNITEIHQRSRFPLLGAHVTADCYNCHTNATSNLLLFGPLGVECIDCHRTNYDATTTPNHVAMNFSTNCIDCHTMNAFSWSGAGFNHTNITSGCVECHLSDYNNTTSPNHTQIGFSTNCKDCHTTNPGWKPADYRDHDSRSFPIYSGKHGGAWSVCSDCHSNPASYSQYTCIDCHDHNQSKMNDDHKEVGGYAYNSPACFACHPTGSKEGTFNHAASAFPLTGAHSTTECQKCHVTGFKGTPSACFSCHAPDYNKSVNPNHATLFLPTECGTCHTTVPDWKPATFDIHNNYYILAGAHVPIATDCNTCHNSNYINSPNTCVGCHEVQYNQSTKPNHITANFPTTCETCHSEVAWAPATFDHNNIYPLIGAHAPIAPNCALCHNSGYVNTPNTCAGCHITKYNESTNPNHITANFPTTCETCHTPAAWSPSSFNHNTVYPLTGAHATIAANCFSCHQGNYSNTPNTCVGCHLPNFNASVNPNHAAINIPTDCGTCHTTNPNWTPATFPIHNNYYVIAGAHVPVSCITCHNGNYNNSTPNTCVGCHLTNYNQTTNPSHTAALFPTSCADCHTQTAWAPANWDHDNQYFPIYSGKHQGHWNTCADCHPNPGNYATFTCTTSCHPQSSMNSKHQGVVGYSYNSVACLNCHPRGSGDKMMIKIFKNE
ncbi:MAG: hypothetical protein WCP32_06805 [Bacteroidota bacterium]